MHWSNRRRAVTGLPVYRVLHVYLSTVFIPCCVVDSNYTGNHGWDNGLPSMHPIFIARGPAFKTNYVAKPFDTINIYALICDLLRIPPQPNNGTVENVREILAADDASKPHVSLRCSPLFFILRKPKKDRPCIEFEKQSV